MADYVRRPSRATPMASPGKVAKPSATRPSKRSADDSYVDDMLARQAIRKQNAQPRKRTRDISIDPDEGLPPDAPSRRTPSVKFNSPAEVGRSVSLGRKADSPTRSSLKGAREKTPTSREDAEAADLQLQLENERAKEGVYASNFDELEEYCQPRKAQRTTKAQSAAKISRTKAPPASKRRGVSDTKEDDQLKSIEATELAQDQIVVNMLQHLTDQIHQYCEYCRPQYEPAGDEGPITEIFDYWQPETIRYAGCLATGGSKGREGWEDVFKDADCRAALLYGVIARALKEEVFGALMFGATEDQAKALSDTERQQVNRDGFWRTRERAKAIRGFLGLPQELPFDQLIDHMTEPEPLVEAQTKLRLQLESLIWPLVVLISGANTSFYSRKLPDAHSRLLSNIIRTASALSLLMRCNGEVVYYFPPTFKEEQFEPSRMWCLNIGDMRRNSPYELKKNDQGREYAKLRNAEDDGNRSEAIVRVVCFPGLVAYRQHGGARAVRLLREEGRHNQHVPEDVRLMRRRTGDECSAEMGFRTRILGKSVVLLKWAKQRRMVREAGTSAARNRSEEEIREIEKSDGHEELWDMFREHSIGDYGPDV